MLIEKEQEKKGQKEGKQIKGREIISKSVPCFPNSEVHDHL